MLQVKPHLILTSKVTPDAFLPRVQHACRCSYACPSMGNIRGQGRQQVQPKIRRQGPFYAPSNHWTATSFFSFSIIYLKITISSMQGQEKRSSVKAVRQFPSSAKIQTPYQNILPSLTILAASHCCYPSFVSPQASPVK